jgi:hypothetical protein
MSSNVVAAVRAPIPESTTPTHTVIHFRTTRAAVPVRNAISRRFAIRARNLSSQSRPRQSRPISLAVVSNAEAVRISNRGNTPGIRPASSIRAGRMQVHLSRALAIDFAQDVRESISALRTGFAGPENPACLPLLIDASGKAASTAIGFGVRNLFTIDTADDPRDRRGPPAQRSGRALHSSNGRR